MTKNNALIVVDAQNDFMPTGALAVADGHKITRPIRYFNERQADLLIFTQDWHPANHFSFAEGTPEYRDGSWPVHCVQNTEGAAIDEDLIEFAEANNTFKKGTNPEVEAYSGFDGNGGSHDEPLLTWLRDRSVSKIYIAGLALDYCVKATALDGVRYEFDTTVLVDCTRPVAYETGTLAVVEMVNAGVRFDTTGFWE